MRLSVKQFFVALGAIILSVFIWAFADFYIKQEEHLSKLIYNNLVYDLTDLNHALSRNISQDTPLLSLRSLMARTAASNDYICVIWIYEGKTPIFNTLDHCKDSIQPSFELQTEQVNAYDILTQYNSINTVFQTFEGLVSKEYQVYFVLDKEAIQAVLQNRLYSIALYFALIPAVLFLLASFFIRHLLTKPMEKLRQYAYYHNSVQGNAPAPFHLNELESIRYSLNMTFNRLDNEQKALFKLSRTDSLSHLMNRHALEEKVSSLIQSSKRQPISFAFLFIDIDNFKFINDSLGHNVGDYLIQDLSQFFSELIRENDSIARIGGDEFVILIQNYDHEENLVRFSERLYSHLKQKRFLDEHHLEIQLSIGIAIFPTDGTTFVELLKNADIAMFEAKRGGKSRYQFYSEGLNTRVQRNIELEKNMKEALPKNQYQMFYQPKIELETGRLTGAEALIRWFDDEGNFISPDQFIPLAEETGFIIPLGNWVLQTCLSQLKQWHEQGMKLTLSINVSSKQLMEQDFCQNLLNLIEQNELDAHFIDLEITEYFLLAESQKSQKTLSVLRALGVRFSLDDFGTGYSSLAYLKKFHVDTIKIDKSFMDDFAQPDGAVFIETIIRMGETLGKTIVAEGVETEEQVAYLKRIGCHSVQGYYFSRPLPIVAFEHFYQQFHK